MCFASFTFGFFLVDMNKEMIQALCEERDRMLHTKKMRTLFAAADESGDGVLEPLKHLGFVSRCRKSATELRLFVVVSLAKDQDEFREIMTSPDIRLDKHRFIRCYAVSY